MSTHSSSDGRKALRANPPRKKEAHRSSPADGILVDRQELTSSEKPGGSHVVPWAENIWDDEVVALIEDRIAKENENPLLNKMDRWAGNHHRKEDWEQAYFIQFALANLDRRFEDEGLRPAFAGVGGIPLDVAEEWLLRGVGLSKEELIGHIFSGDRPHHPMSLFNESNEAMRFLAEIIDFTPQQWDRIEEMFFASGWVQKFEVDEFTPHYGVRIRKHFLSNRHIPDALFTRLLDEVVKARLVTREPFSGALGWMLSNAGFSADGLKKITEDILKTEAYLEVGLKDIQVDWELLCSHPNWTPELRDMLAFHESITCGRRTRQPHSGCNLLKISPCMASVNSPGANLDKSLYEVKGFIELTDLRQDSIQLNAAARDFVLCPHEHPWPDMTKKVAMATMETVEADVLPPPKVFAYMMPGYGLARMMLAETAGRFENGKSIPTEWLRELI